MEKNFFVKEEQLSKSISIAEELRKESVTNANNILTTISSLKDSILIDNKTIDIGENIVIKNMNAINKNLNGLSNTLNYIIKMYNQTIDNSTNYINSKIGEDTNE